VLQFLNDTLFEGKGAFNKEFRVKGKTYPDLKIPAKEAEKGFEIVELKVRTSRLKYLRGDLKGRDEIFSASDHFYFSYLLQVGSKDPGKIIKDRVCIYYLVVIKISKRSLSTPIHELVEAIRMGTKDFTKEEAEKSGLDEEKEELLGVDNMIKTVDLERKVRGLEADLEEEKTLRKQKEKQIDEKEKQIDEKEKQLAEERRLRKEEKKEIERLKAQLKKK
jgi:hypothetical protein